MIGLTQMNARKIIEVVGSSGVPPEWGFQFFTVGIDSYMKILEADYLSSFIRQGGSSFKMVIGAYGGGKTHFLYNIRESAWNHNFLVSYCPLSHEESPFFRIEKIYRSIVVNMMYPLPPDELIEGGEKGFDSFLKVVFQDWRKSCEDITGGEGTAEERLFETIRNATRGIESVNFSRAVRAALFALVDKKENDFDDIVQWMRVDGFDRNVHRKFGILQSIDRGQAFSMIRSLVQFLRNLNYSGLVILFDEAEQIPSLSTKQREQMLSNLREIIDECGHSSFKNVMIFYAIPNEAFFEGRAAVYEALKQRINSVFDFYNPTGVKIYLEKLVKEPEKNLVEIGKKLYGIYSAAYQTEFPQEAVAACAELIAKASYKQRFGDIGYKRLFVQGVIRGFNQMRLNRNLNMNEEWANGIVASL